MRGQSPASVSTPTPRQTATRGAEVPKIDRDGAAADFLHTLLLISDTLFTIMILLTSCHVKPRHFGRSYLLRWALLSLTVAHRLRITKAYLHSASPPIHSTSGQLVPHVEWKPGLVAAAREASPLCDLQSRGKRQEKHVSVAIRLLISHAYAKCGRRGLRRCPTPSQQFSNPGQSV